MQLKRLVSEFPRAEPTSYAFTYADTATFEEEIDEWFAYGSAENMRVSRARVSFGARWKQFSGRLWGEETRETRRDFVRRECEGLRGESGAKRKALMRVMHILLGVWDESAGVGKKLSHVLDCEGKWEEGEPQVRSQATRSQVDAMKEGVQLVTECGGIPALYDTMRAILDGVR
jgi:hypothetical protein